MILVVKRQLQNFKKTPLAANQNLAYICISDFSFLFSSSREVWGGAASLPISVAVPLRGGGMGVVLSSFNLKIVVYFTKKLQLSFLSR